MAADVQSMSQYWKNFDLPELQKELDTTATDLANRQDESDISRKRLVEQSRDFKKNTPEDIRKVVAPLLKSFQAEVDSLSKRSKTSEAAFLSLYKKLIDLPDPAPALEYAVQIQKKACRVQDLEIENKGLRETLDEYNHEFAEVKNQEVTIKQLKDKLREHEERLEATAEARAKEKERELQRQFAEKERQLQEQQLTVAKKLGEAELRVSQLQKALESAQSELFETKAKYEETTSAKASEMDILMADIERANERAADSEREVERLRRQLASATQTLQQAEEMSAAPDMEQAIDVLKRSNLEVELAAKEKEITQLVEDVQRLQASLNKQRESSNAQIARLEEELEKKNKALRSLEERLRSQEDYEEVKRELNVLKSLEFGGEEGKGKSLEVLLLEKNKALQTENTQVKVAHAEVSGSPTTPSSPAITTQSDAFASTVGEELGHRYPATQSRSGASSPALNGLPPQPPITPTASTVPYSPSDLNRHFSLSCPPYLGYAHPPSPYYPLNMVKSECGGGGSGSAGALDTAYVAKTVRELLSIHNIGQRLFAKHVLGLSQGTVSELLSKPKSWDKLTEKGRESYRKMHAWATDDRNICALKAISPKKGSQPLVPSVAREDSATEERIAQLLSEAQQAMQLNKTREQTHPLHMAYPDPTKFHYYDYGLCDQQVANAVVSSFYHQEFTKMMSAKMIVPSSSPATSVTSSTGESRSHEGSSKKGHSHHHEEGHYSGSGSKHGRSSSKESAASGANEEMVRRIYRQELENLARAAESSGNTAASSMYQQELARLAQQVQMKNNYDYNPSQVGFDRHNGLAIKSEPPDSTSDDLASQANGPIDLSKPHSSSTSNSTLSSTAVKEEEKEPREKEKEKERERVREKDRDRGTPMSDPGPSRHTGSAFMMVRPQRLNGQEEPNGPPPPPANFSQSTPECLSPLQRMQNIANSLTSRPNMGMPSHKPLKAVLPPITQEQFDKYSNINTDELVKKVKETLSQYSISQRLFGENVLGLSQGSVSDLLARPKPWHMLTQKGREPFIRMQFFLEDAEAIPKLVASQYRIPPDKLMRNQRGSDSAHRRRKSSMENSAGGYDTPPAPKRPRVFFTEEQKEALRSAYTLDPYPNQTTIENLAQELGVGVKTVINWFHNHRMRAKQQHHSTGNTTPNSGSNSGPGEYNQGTGGVKSEPMDESSNQSDISSISGDASGFHSSGSFRHGSIEGGQWMFPQFEPVQNAGSLKSSQGDGANNGFDNDDDTRSQSNVSRGATGGDRDGGSEKEGDLMDEVDSASGVSGAKKSPLTSPAPKENPTNEGSAGPSTPQPPPPPPAVVNKRKRSQPQRVYEGTQLERGKTETASVNLEGASDEDFGEDVGDDAVLEEEKGNDSMDVRDDSPEDSKQGHSEDEDKVPKGKDGTSEEWEESGRLETTEKLPKNIETSSDENWHF